MRWQNNQLHLAIVVQPNAKQTKVVGLYQAHIKIQINKPATENKANLFLLKWLANEFGVPPTQVVLKKGQQSRFKQIVINAPQKMPSWLDELGVESDK